jgi:hypothetical protein
MDEMHNSKSDCEFHTLARKFLGRWRRKNLKSFADHFEEQWINGDFSNWLIYQTPPGYSSSNTIEL